jgi:hypothetical protein
LIFLRARYLSTTQGRFLQHDAWPGDYTQPQTRNGWSYVEGNPINRVDPSGHEGYSRNSPEERLVQIDYEIYYALRGDFEGEFDIKSGSRTGLKPIDRQLAEILGLPPTLMGTPTFGAGRADIVHTLPGGKLGLAYEIEPLGLEWDGAAEINWYIQVYNLYSEAYFNVFGEHLEPRLLVHGLNYSNFWRPVGVVNGEVVQAKLYTAGVIVWRHISPEKPEPVTVSVPALDPRYISLLLAAACAAATRIPRAPGMIPVLPGGGISTLDIK